MWIFRCGNHKGNMPSVTRLSPPRQRRTWYMLEECGGVSTGASANTEPTWNTGLGAVTNDGALQWTVMQVGGDLSGDLWQPGKQYSLDAWVRLTVTNGASDKSTRIRVANALSGARGADLVARNTERGHRRRSAHVADLFLSVMHMSTWSTSGRQIPMESGQIYTFPARQISRSRTA